MQSAIGLPYLVASLKTSVQELEEYFSGKRKKFSGRMEYQEKAFTAGASPINN